MRLLHAMFISAILLYSLIFTPFTAEERTEDINQTTDAIHIPSPPDVGFRGESASWLLETVDSFGDVGYHPSIDIDSSGHPHISYKDQTNSDLKYAKWTGDEWHVETVDSIGNYRGKTSIALDSNGYPHIGYSTAVGLKYARWTGSVWEKLVVDYGSFPSIAIDSLGRPHISYWNDISDDLKYANWTGSVWNIDVADSDGDVGAYTSLALDSDDHPHISYTEWLSTQAQYNLKYAKWTGGSWVTETVDSQGNVGKPSSIALSSSGFPHISYCDDALQDLKYARWSGTSWEIETVDLKCVDSTSIALDVNGYPHISYWESANRDLKYAKWTGSIWEKETVDSEGDVGHFQSMALDSNGNPHISYCDHSPNYDLKYARMVDMEVNSLSILNPEPVSTDVYARYRPYIFRVNVTDTVSFDDVGTVLLTLDPLGTNIQLLWNQATGDITKVHDSSNCITLEPSSDNYNDSCWQWTIEFNVTFNWNYPDEDFHDVSVHATSTLLQDAWLNVTDFYRVENDLEFAGDMVVLDDEGFLAGYMGYVRGGSNLTVRGLTPVYEATALHPPDDEFDVGVWTDSACLGTCDPATGEQAEVTFPVTREMSPDGFHFYVNITGIPSECDRSDEHFAVHIDAVNVSFSEQYPLENEWVTTSEFETGIEITDPLAVMVDGQSVQFRKSGDNGSSWSSWLRVPVSSAMTVNPTTVVMVRDGIDNLFQWRAKDTLGNGPALSPTYKVKVDTQGPIFLDFSPGPDVVSSDERVEMTIRVADTVSDLNPGSLEVRVSYNGGQKWLGWQHTGWPHKDGNAWEVNVHETFSNGTDNLVQFRASDNAGNGPVESEVYNVKVNTWKPPPEFNTTLLAPADGSTINGTEVTLSWEVDQEWDGIVYDLYLNTSGSFTDKDEPTYTDTELSVVIGLPPGETYYWTVIPRYPLYGWEGKCLSGVWTFDVAPITDLVDFGVDVSYEEEVILEYPSSVTNIWVDVVNTGSARDVFQVFVESGEGVTVRITGEKEVSVPSGLTAGIAIEIRGAGIGSDESTTFNVTAVSVGADDADLDVRDTEVVTVSVSDIEVDRPRDDDDNEPSGLMGALSFMLLLLVIIAVIIIVALLLWTRRRKRPKEAEPSTQDGQAIAVDIIKPGQARPKGPVRLTPAEVVDIGDGAGEDSGPAAGASHGASGGGLAMSPSSRTAQAARLPEGPAAPGTGVIPADRLLPKAPRPTKPVVPEKTSMWSRLPSEKPLVKPTDAPKVIEPEEPAQKLEIYHNDSGAVWTPDLATERTAKEAESAVEMLPKLKKMLGDGVLTQEEYEVHKRRLLRKL